ncbi:MAG: hypothetical protein WDO70_07860 [Alphaproteobacteria bacterium]
MFDSITRGERDFSALISRLKQAHVNILLYGGYYTEAGLLCGKSAIRAWTSHCWAATAMVSNEFWSIAGKGGRRDADDLPPRSPEQFRSQGRRRADSRHRLRAGRRDAASLCGGGSLDGGASQGRKAGRAAIAAALRDGEYSTVLGRLAFNAKGDVKDPQFVVYRWSEGTYKEIKE